MTSFVQGNPAPKTSSVKQIDYKSKEILSVE